MASGAPGADVLAPFAGLVEHVWALAIPGEPNAHPAEALLADAATLGIPASPGVSILNALAEAGKGPPTRLVFCGSLYLAGHVLHQNGTPPR